MAAAPRRVVTGHDAAGTSVVLSDGPVPVSRQIPEDGVAFHEVWNTSGAPAPIAAAEDEPTERELAVPPPPRGTKIRVNEFAPGFLDERGCSRRSTAPSRSTTASCSRARSPWSSTTPR